jgi:nucleotide-binding universal stress UspA family protein
MMIRTIFVPLAEGLSTELLLDAALQVAKLTQAHIRAMFIRPEPEAALADMPGTIIGAGAGEAVERESRRAAAVEKTHFETWQARNSLEGGAGIDTWFATWADTVGEIENVVARHGRVSDLIVVPHVASGSFSAQRCFDTAVFETGRPVLLVPEALPFDITDHLLIAWDGSLEASRAVFGAIPLLRLAKRVTVFTARQHDAEHADQNNLADALSLHDIRVHIMATPKSRMSTGEALVNAATIQKATLIVMGAYTHSRLRQSFLGGVTRHLLTHAPVPLLMSH